MENVLVVGIIFLSIVALVKIVSDSRIRRQLIEKGLVDERVKHFFGGSDPGILSNVKWGMILVAVGLAVFASRLLPYYLEEEGTFGLVLIFAGIAFLSYYGIASRRLRKKDREQPTNPRP